MPHLSFTRQALTPSRFTVMRSLLVSLLVLTPSLSAQGTPQDVSPPGALSVRRVSLDAGDSAHLVATSNLASGQTIHESFDAGASWVELTSFNTIPGAEIRLDANGDLIVIDRFRALGSPGAIRRRSNGALSDIPAPTASGAVGSVSVHSIETHPTHARSMAVVTIEAVGDGLGTVVYRAYATDNDGASWSFLLSRSRDSGNGGTALDRLEYTHLANGTGLVVHEDYTDQSWSQTDVRTWTLSPVSSSFEVGNGGSTMCRVAGVRSEPGTLFAVVPGTNGVPRPIQRRSASTPWASVGDAGTFTDLAVGRVDARLVVRHRSTPSSEIEVSRDAGGAWSTLAGTGNMGLFVRQLVGFSSLDEALFFIAQDASGVGPHRLFRIPVETVLGVEECAGVPNSTGVAGLLQAIGRPEAQANRVLLSVRNLPPLQFYLPLASRDSGLLPSPGGSDGTLCLGGDIGRVLSATASATTWGEGVASIDASAIPGGSSLSSATAGDTWRFQVWYRDGGSQGGSNLTNSVAITFQ